MPPRLKRAPPYEDDPGCKYIVIDDPWPGDKIGKRRDDVYINYLSAWVRFMLGKAHEVDCVYTVNTRSEVIVQLPEDADLEPILGAHAWHGFLSRGKPSDGNRVSHVFAYNYRMKGHPANHNWEERLPTVTGDPPAHVDFPVYFPYPRAHWASPRGKNCADISLPLPPSRQPTPPPADTSHFTPYSHPSQLTSNTVSNAERRDDDDDDKRDSKPQTPADLRVDAFREDAMESLRQNLKDADVKPRVKPEPDSAEVKSEPIKREEPVYGPSKSFRTAVQELGQARTMAHEQRSQTDNTLSSSGQAKDVKPKKEDLPSGPSEAFEAAFREHRNGQGAIVEKNTTTNIALKAKEEPDSLPPKPSASFVEAYNEWRNNDRDVNSTPSSHGNNRIKLDPDARARTYPVGKDERRRPRDKFEPDDAAKPSVGAPKRPKEEEQRVPAKRFKTE